MSGSSEESSSRLVLLPEHENGANPLPEQYLDAHRSTVGKSMIIQYSSASILETTAWTDTTEREEPIVIVVDDRVTGPIGGLAEEWRAVTADVEELQNGQDLTRLAMVCTRRLEDLATEDGTPVVWFDSLAETLDHVDIDSVVRFLQVCMGSLEEIDAMGHFLCRPDQLDRTALTTLRRVFSTVVTIDDGDWTVENQ